VFINGPSVAVRIPPRTLAFNSRLAYDVNQYKKSLKGRNAIFKTPVLFDGVDMILST